MSTAASRKTRAWAYAIGWALLWMTFAPKPAASQSAWPGYPGNTAIAVTSGGNVGIGTANPSGALSVASTSGGGIAVVENPLWNTGYSGGTMLWIRNSGSNTGNNYIRLTSGWNGTSGTEFGVIGAGGNGSLLINDSAGPVVVQSSGGSVGIGTTNPQYRLSVNGTIGAKEVVVTNTGWADYVFQRGYRLRPLSELKAYIQENGHLPDIPSEAEVKEKGIGVGEMQAKLLAKIEELTLHMIQQNEENQQLRSRIAVLENRADASGNVKRLSENGL